MKKYILICASLVMSGCSMLQQPMVISKISNCGENEYYNSDANSCIPYSTKEEGVISEIGCLEQMNNICTKSLVKIKLYSGKEVSLKVPYENDYQVGEVTEILVIKE
jgi:hypothetical protein